MLIKPISPNTVGVRVSVLVGALPSANQTRGIPTSCGAWVYAVNIDVRGHGSVSGKATPEQTSEVTLIFDQTFGERLRKVALPAWITMSDTNAPIVRELWAETPGRHYLKGLTGFTEAQVGNPVSRLLQ